MRKYGSRLAVVLALNLTLGLSACKQAQEGANDPKGRLQSYISKSFSVKKPEEKNELMGFLSGDARMRLASWSDEQFREAFVDAKREFVKLQFREVKPVSKTEVNITYELTYMDQAKAKDAKITNRKLCRMVLEEGSWRISEVKNIKELIEYKNEMSLP